MSNKRIEIRSKVMNNLIGVIVITEEGQYWESKNKSKIELMPLNDFVQNISSVLRSEHIAFDSFLCGMCE